MAVKKKNTPADLCDIGILREAFLRPEFNTQFRHKRLCELIAAHYAEHATVDGKLNADIQILNRVVGFLVL